jgi:hypothetical protein
VRYDESALVTEIVAVEIEVSFLAANVTLVISGCIGTNVVKVICAASCFVTHAVVVSVNVLDFHSGLLTSGSIALTVVVSVNVSNRYLFLTKDTSTGMLGVLVNARLIVTATAAGSTAAATRSKRQYAGKKHKNCHQ